MTNWATEFNHYTDEYAADAVEIWAQLRETCPVARSDSFRGMWVPTRHEDIVAIANDVDTFSSRSPLVAQYGSMADFGVVAPPISSDPPYHTEIRRMLLPFFSPGRIEKLRPSVEAHCDQLIDAFIEGDGCDAAQQYANFIPVQVIATMLGIPPQDGDQFRIWVEQLLENAPVNIEIAGMNLFQLFGYFGEHMEAMKASPGDDLISFLVANAHEVIGRELQQDELFGMCLLLLLAGIDTTWSAIGASIWHLASAPGRSSAAARRRSAVARRHRRIAAGVRARHDGARSCEGHRVQGVPDEGGRPLAVAVPVGEPRPVGVRPRR